MMIQESRVVKLFLMIMLAMGAVLFAGAPDVNAGGVTVYKNGEKHVKIGGRIQVQYHLKDPDTGSSSDEVTDTVFFRRLRPYISGSVHKDWNGKFQFDIGGAKSDNELAIKDAYMEYKGIKHVKIKLGNSLAAFSREGLTSSKKQQLVERTFVGDHNYGTPDRNMGIHLHGTASDKTIEYAVSLAAADIDPDHNKVDFDTPANKHGDFNQGWFAGARVSYHPFGHLKLAQGDFKGVTKATISLAGYAWNNDDDNNTHTDASGADTSSGKKPDVDTVTGIEISGAIRSHGASVDAQYNIINADTIDPSITGGIYKNGTTTLSNFAIEGGYMVLPQKVELVLAYQLQDSDNYDKQWTRTSFGANYFVHKQDIKVQATYRIGQNVKGVDNNDLNEFFLQGQYVF